MKKAVYFVIAAFFIVGTLWCFWIRSLEAAFEYEIQVKCAAMPLNDGLIEEWLCTQPGVSKCLVKRYGALIRINFVMVQDFAKKRPPTPDLESALERFGYTGRSNFESERRLYFGT